MEIAGVFRVWFRRELSTAFLSDRNSGMYRSEAAMRSIRSIAAGESSASQSPAVRGEVLLRGEVVDVGGADVEQGTTGGAGRVDDGEGAGVTGRADDRGHDAGRGLVVRVGVDVHALHRLECGEGAARCLDDVRGLEPRGRCGLGELRPELAEGQVLGTALDEAERGGVPERGRAAVAEDDLVALGDLEQVGEAGADAADQVLDGLLAVRGAEDRGAARHEGLELCAADLRRSAAEATVGGEEFGRDDDVCHAPILTTTIRLPEPVYRPDGEGSARSSTASDDPFSRASGRRSVFVGANK